MANRDKTVIKSLVLESVYPNIAFGDRGDKKHFLNTLLAAKASFPVNVLGYSINSDSANLLLSSANAGAIDSFATAAAQMYAEHYSSKYAFGGGIFRMPIVSNNVKQAELTSTLAYIHMLPERLGLVPDFKKYRYSSCRAYMKGHNELLDKDAMAYLTGLDRVDRNSYISWHSAPDGKRVASSRLAREKFNDVMSDLRIKYENGVHVQEDVLKWYIYELNKRCGMPYHKIARRLGVPLKKRKDLLIEVIIIMCKNDGCSFNAALASLQLKMKNMTVFGLLVQVAVSALNRYGFSYDYLINMLKVEDGDFAVLVEIIKLINRDYGYDFVQIATNLHLQLNRQEVMYSVLQSLCLKEGMSIDAATAKIGMDMTADLLTNVLISANMKYNMPYEYMLKAFKVAQITDYILISVVREMIVRYSLTFEAVMNRLGLHPPYDKIRELV